MIIDAAIPQYSYPDMVTQTIHVGDCELLEHYMDVTDGANPKWATWPNRTWLEGMNASAHGPNPYRAARPAARECVNGWRGLTPLALNPLWARPARAEFYDPAGARRDQWTHWDDLRNVYGVDADGYALDLGQRRRAVRPPALTTAITPAEFLDLNARSAAGRTRGHGQEGCPFIPALCAEPGAVRPVEPAQHAARPTAARRRRRGARATSRERGLQPGLVFRGEIDIPTIDWRHYLEDELDMHNSHQSFASRKRMLNLDGDASNQVIWFTDARPARVRPDAAGARGDRRVDGEHPRAPRPGVAGNKPAAAVDSCFATTGR